MEISRSMESNHKDINPLSQIWIEALKIGIHKTRTTNPSAIRPTLLAPRNAFHHIEITPDTVGVKERMTLRACIGDIRIGGDREMTMSTQRLE